MLHYYDLKLANNGASLLGWNNEKLVLMLKHCEMNVTIQKLKRARSLKARGPSMAGMYDTSR